MCFSNVHTMEYCLFLEWPNLEHLSRTSQSHYTVADMGSCCGEFRNIEMLITLLTTFCMSSILFHFGRGVLTNKYQSKTSKYS